MRERLPLCSVFTKNFETAVVQNHERRQRGLLQIFLYKFPHTLISLCFDIWFMQGMTVSFSHFFYSIFFKTLFHMLSKPISIVRKFSFNFYLTICGASRNLMKTFVLKSFKTSKPRTLAAWNVIMKVSITIDYL